MTDGPAHVTAPHLLAGESPRGTFTRVAAVVRRMIGAPDYDAYLRHATACHPERAPLTAAEFQDERLRARYSTPGNRCC